MNFILRRWWWAGGVLLAAHGVLAATSKPPIPDLTQGAQPGEGPEWNLGPTGARGWMYSWRGTADARQIKVTAVDRGSPADGRLQAGDVILGIGSKPFDGDARIQLARAIADAESEDGGGRLLLLVWREGLTRPVELKLEVLGRYSGTAPYDCPKSRRIFERGCEFIARKGLSGVSIPNCWNALALLASGKEDYRPLLAAFAREVAAYRTDAFATWLYGYANIFLAEYVMATGDRSVMDGVRRLALEAARGQSKVGTWGHKFARPDGNLDGYGCMNQPGLSLTISLVLAREAGVREPELDEAIARSARFLRWFVNKGAIPYGDHQPFFGHEDNGKCSSGAVLFDLVNDSEAAGFFARMATAAYAERERGHTGNFFNFAWAMPGVARAGPWAAAAYWKQQSWYYDLARTWNGGFVYQGSPLGEEEHGKYTKWDCTGAYLMAFALPLKSLYLTGRKGCSVPPLTPEEADAVIAAGAEYSRADESSGYERRSTEALLAGLSSWSPVVRGRSARALGKRHDDVVPTLLRMLDSADLNARYGACEALAWQGPRADAAGPRLRALLNDPDPWLQSLACMALAALGPEQRKASVQDLLQVLVRPHPADPRRMADRAACCALFAPYPGSRTPQPILRDSLEGVDRPLLRAAIRSALSNEDSVARQSVARIFHLLDDSDWAELLPDLLKAIERLAPSNEMFGDGIRLAGLDVLSRMHLREGIELCVSVIEPERWGAENRLPRCLEYLKRYRAHAQSVLPRLQAVRDALHARKGNLAQQVDETIAAIRSATDSPPLMDVPTFRARAAGKQM